MSDLLAGLIVAVSAAPVGTQTASAALAGDSVLLLDDTVDMNPTGGQVTINGVVTDYASSDDDASTITLKVPLAAGVAEGADVWPYPQRVEKTAMVLIDGASDPIPATVPWNMQDALPTGVREEEDREDVRLTRDGEFSWAVFDLSGQSLSRDGAYVWNPYATRRMAAVTIASSGSVWTTVTAWTDDVSQGVTVGTSSITINYTGFYSISALCAWAASDTGRRYVAIAVNGTQVAVNSTAGESGANVYTACSEAAFLNEGDVVTVQIRQNSGANLAILTGSGSKMSIYRVSV